MTADPAAEPVDLLLVGHVTRDRLPDGWRLGGAVAYAARLAERLGVRPGIVTSTGADLDLTDLAGASRRIVPAAETTTFENHYRPTGREQRLIARANPLEVSAVPAAWWGAPGRLLAPVAAEVSDSFAAAPPGGLLALALQGWLRAWDANGQIHYRLWEDPAGLLARADLVFLSAEDLAGDRAALDFYRARHRRLIVTQGAAGCTIYEAGQTRNVSGYPAREVDPTGAGDIFATACLLAFQAGEDLESAARFANAAAALAIEGPGFAAIPDRPAIRRRMAGR